MKFTWVFLALVSTPLMIYSQESADLAEIKNVRDSLKRESSSILSMIQILEDSIRSIESGLIIDGLQGNPFVGRIKSIASIRDKPDIDSKLLVSIRKQDSVLVLDYIEGYFQVQFQDYIGFVNQQRLVVDDKLVALRELRRKELAEQARNEKQIREREFEEQRSKEEAMYRSHFTEPYEKLGVGILIRGIEVDNINAADGVSLSIRWAHLIPNKTVKYIDFHLTPYNAVGDQVSCRIRRTSEFVGRVTGPIEMNFQVETARWENAWYDNTVQCIRIDRIDVFYTDGAKFTYIKDLKKLYNDQFTNDCSYK